MKKCIFRSMLAMLTMMLFSSLTAQIPKETSWKVKAVKVVNHDRQSNVLDTLTAFPLSTAFPNVELVSKAASDSVNVCLQTFTLPNLSKSADFNILCSTFSYQSSDSIFTAAIGRVLFKSSSSARKIFTTAVTGANKTYAVYSATKAITTLYAGYIVRLHYIATTPTTGTWYISEPIAIR